MTSPDTPHDAAKNDPAWCPTCGASVRVVSEREGTSHFEPVAKNDPPRRALARCPGCDYFPQGAVVRREDHLWHQECWIARIERLLGLEQEREAQMADERETAEAALLAARQVDEAASKRAARVYWEHAAEHDWDTLPESIQTHYIAAARAALLAALNVKPEGERDD